MNRQIKFRIWDSSIEELIYPEKYINAEYDFCIGADFKSYSFDGGRDWGGCTLQQFTGFLDKDGCEIYEGDIVYIESYGHHEIVWDCFKWDTKYLNIDDFDFFPICNFFESQIPNEKITSWEVVGNIFKIESHQNARCAKHKTP